MEKRDDVNNALWDLCEIANALDDLATSFNDTGNEKIGSMLYGYSFRITDLCNVIQKSTDND